MTLRASRQATCPRSTKTLTSPPSMRPQEMLAWAEAGSDTAPHAITATRTIRRIELRIISACAVVGYRVDRGCVTPAPRTVEPSAGMVGA